MPFDPAKPADHSEIKSQELRDQLTALRAESARSIGNLAPLDFDPSDPPTFEDVQAIIGKVDALIALLRG